MLDLSQITTRDILLENIYTSEPVFKNAVVNSGIIPTTPVTSESVVIPDLSMPIFELNGKWVYGADVQTFYKGEGAEKTLSVTWWAMKDVLVPKRYKRDVAPEIQAVLERQVVTNLKRVITLAREKKLHSLLTTTSNYASGFSATPATKWDASSGTTIIDDIQAGIMKLNDRGLAVAGMIMPRRVWSRIKFADEFKNLYVDRNYATLSFLKDLFDIPEIIIPSVTTMGKPKKSSAVTPTELWGDDVILYTNQPLGSGTYPFIVEAVLQDALVQRMPANQERLSQEIIAREAKDFNLLNKDAGYLIHDVLS
jgi:hypothetical protein